MKITARGEEIHLLPEKAFFWPKEKILGFSDVHLGKAESFQKMGIPLPSGEHLEDLENISNLIESTGATRVFILGDLVHAKSSWTENIERSLDQFFEKHKLIEWNLLLGNHERGSLKKLEGFPIQLMPEHHRIGDIIFSHGHLEMNEGESAFQIAGHVHPVTVLHEGSVRLRLPCSVFEEDYLILPSFGKLTGGYEVRNKKNQRLFAVAGSEVFEVNSKTR